MGASSVNKVVLQGTRPGFIPDTTPDFSRAFAPGWVRLGCLARCLAGVLPAILEIGQGWHAGDARCLRDASFGSIKKCLGPYLLFSVHACLDQFGL